MCEQAISLLLIEDDDAIRTLLARGLRAHGYVVDQAADGGSGLEKALTGAYDLVLLDLGLQGWHGFEILAQCRSRVGTPFIVITARTDLDARLRSFEHGAVDWIAKPLFVEELVARIRARLGRHREERRRIVQFGGVEVDADAREVRVDGALVVFTAHELAILLHLAERAGRAVTRDQLRESALPFGSDALDRTIDSHISRIRKKLGAEGSHLATVFGIGYRLDGAAR